MKKSILLLIAIFASFLSYCQVDLGISGEENWFENWTNFNPRKQEYKKTNKSIIGLITKDTTLSSKYTYLLKGVVYVTNNATLTIEPGTIIRGDYKSCGTLVVTKGAKIIAEGTDVNPIVFTSNLDNYSRKPGDWGGIIIMGDAPVNTHGGIGVLDFDLLQKYTVYGGDNPESSSGVLKYVRIEFCGRKLSLKKELNGISFAGVGNKTIIENIQVSYSNDDSFEFYGGNVKLNNLISYRTTDDDFDFTQGVQSIITNSIAVRNPYSSDNQSSRSFEIDTYDKMENFDSTRSSTNVKATNITLVNTEDNNQGLVKEAINLNKESYLTIENSIVYGFRDFLIVNEALNSEEFEEFVKLKNIRISHCKNDFGIKNNEKIVDLGIKYDYLKHKIKITDDIIDSFFINPNLKNSPDFRHISIEKSANTILYNKN